jgi:hypothetical protein
MEVLSRILSILMIVILIFLLPLDYLLGHQNVVADGYVERELTGFVDQIREEGYIDKGTYEGFVDKLSVTGMNFDIEFEHAVPKEGNSFSAVEDLPGVLLASANVNDLPYGNTKSDDIRSFAVHTHTADCFAGHRHTTECTTVPITFSLYRYSSSDTNSDQITVNCGYCQLPILMMEIIRTSGNSNYITISDYINKIYNKRVDFYANYTEYNMYVSQFTQLKNNLTPYIKATTSNISSISSSYTDRGYVSNMTFSLPSIGTFTDCPSCNGTPYIFELVGGYSYDDGNFSYTYYCTHCGKKIMNISCSYWATNPYLLTIYRNDQVFYTNNDTNTLLPIYNSIGTLTDSRRMVSINESWLQLAVVKDALNHGCTYPKPPCQLFEDTTPICNQVVTSITASNPVQTVDLGKSIITTATATYLDGHTGTVYCSSNFNSNVAGTQTVTLTYSGLVGNAKTTGTRTCTINVTVRANSIPASLTVTPSSYTVYNGQEPAYSVLVKYNNGSSKVITSGYMKTGWSSVPGVKTLTFSYTENGVTVTTGLTITVKPNLLSITVSPLSQIVERYTDPIFSVRAYYEDGSNKEVTGARITGYNKTFIGNQSVTVTYTENSISRSSAVIVTVTPLKRICPTCGNSYYLNNNDFDTGCPVCKATAAYIQVSPSNVTVNRGDLLNITVTATFKDGHTEAVMGWTSNFDPDRLGLQLVMVVFQGKFAYVSVMVVSTRTCSICGATYQLNDDGTDPGCPICKSALVSISASPEYQSVNQGEDITLTVTGTFRDGHTEEIQDWYNDYDKDRAGEQLVTVYYINSSCNVTVEVFSALNITCPVCGTVYNLREHPWGCPVCADTLTGIEATLQSGGILVSYGEELDFRVVLTYRDGHRAIAFDGWTDTFDPYTMGPQTVTVSYMDRFDNTVSCTVNVEVSDKILKKVCENGHVYYTEVPLAECPYCAAGGIIQEQYYSMSFTDEIIDKLYTDGIYRMNSGDYITVKVKIKTQGSIYSFSLFHKKKDALPVTYGGEVA